MGLEYLVSGASLTKAENWEDLISSSFSEKSGSVSPSASSPVGLLTVRIDSVPSRQLVSTFHSFLEANNDRIETIWDFPEALLPQIFLASRVTEGAI